MTRIFILFLFISLTILLNNCATEPKQAVPTKKEDNTNNVSQNTNQSTNVPNTQQTPIPQYPTVTITQNDSSQNNGSIFNQLLNEILNKLGVNTGNSTSNGNSANGLLNLFEQLFSGGGLAGLGLNTNSYFDGGSDTDYQSSTGGCSSGSCGIPNSGLGSLGGCSSGSCGIGSSSNSKSSSSEDQKTSSSSNSSCPNGQCNLYDSLKDNPWNIDPNNPLGNNN